MDVTLHNAKPDDLLVVKNLVPYYIYDFSEHMGWPCTREGRFDGCDGIESYWSEPGKHAFVLRAGKEWAGFAMINAQQHHPNIDYSVAEFFILRKFRGRGAGEKIARQLFDRFRGRWLVEQLAKNTPAVAFWRKVIGRYTSNRFEERAGTSGWGPTNVLLF